jgi:hypothetical protein
VTVENPDVIDQITRSEDGSAFTLDMIESRDFSGSQEQLEQLVAKVNSYVEAIQTGRLVQQYPEMAGKQINVRLVCMDEPRDAKLVELLGVATRLFAKHHADFAVQIIPREFMARRAPGE